MSAIFMHSPDYIEVCGNRTVLELATSLISIFNRHDNKFPASALEAKTFGRVVDIMTLRDEMSCLQSVLAESEDPVGFFWETAMYLHERKSAAQERMEFIAKQVKEQEELRLRFKIAAHGPTLPREIVDTILGRVPSNNELRWEGLTQVYVDGLLPLAVYNPSLVLPYYDNGAEAGWTLGVIAKQKLRRTVLEDAALAHQIKLRVENEDRTTSDDITDLRPLMNYPHLWKTLDVCLDEFNMDEFLNWYFPCFPFLEELDVAAESVTSSGVVIPLDGYRLKTASLSFRTFSDFFNTGCLKSITSLSLLSFNPNLFVDHDAFKEALHNFPQIIDQLPSLYKLALWFVECEHSDLEDLPRIKSSLRSLDVGIDSNDSVLAATFLTLFADCHIDTIGIEARFLGEAEVLFGRVLRVCIEDFIPEILSERNNDGNIPFPRMEQLELRYIEDTSEHGILQVQNRLLQTVRTRYEDPTVCRIGLLRIPREVISNTQFQEELERYIPSLVLTD